MNRPLVWSAATMSALLLGAPHALAQTPSDNTNESESIVVTGVRASLVEGLEVKRNATQVVESIVAEDIGKLPDNNVIEALQRVAGVQITDRGGAEASAIAIRGLPDVTTTWNGRNVFTANGRAVALQDIPSNLVREIDVYKTRAADQLETGIAGQIDVQTHRPFDFDGLKVSLAGRATYQEQRDSYDPNVSALVSDRWQTSAGEFGALFNVSYVRTKYRAQSVTAGALVPFATADNPPPGFVPIERIFNGDGRASEDPIWQAGTDRGLPETPGSTLNFNGVAYPYLLARDALFASDLQGDRERPAVNAAFQWAPNENSTYTFEVFYQGYREELFNNLHFTFADWWGGLGSDPGSTISLYPGTNVMKTRLVGFPYGFQSGDSTKQDTDTYVYALNGKWHIGERLDLAADLSYTDSEFNTSFIAVRTERVAGAIQLDFNHNDGIPSWHFGDIDSGGNFVNHDERLLDPASWTLAQLYNNAGRTAGDATTLTVDGDYDVSNDFLKKVSFGVRYDDRNASSAGIPSNDNPVLYSGQPMTALPQAFQWTNSNFFDGRADVPTSWMVANGYYVRDHADEIRNFWGAPTSDQLQLVNGFNVEEKTTSAYIQADFDVGQALHGEVGVRYVNVDTGMDFTDLSQASLPKSDASAQVDDILPSLTLRYDFSNDFHMRFNYGETLRRPNFGDLNPNFALTEDLTGVGYGSGTGGNSSLGATKAKNYDLTAEWYFAPDSALYGTVFKRQIDGLVVPLTRRITITGTGLNTDSFVVTQPVNASNGEIKGVEVGLVYFPDYLPGVLDGLGVQASFTKLDSSQNIPQTNAAGDIIGEETTGFFDVSDTSYNVTAAYDRGGLGMRLSYVWREEFLHDNEARIFANPIGHWRRPESSLDFQATYEMNKAVSFTLDATNLTDELEQSYYRFADAGSPQVTNFGNAIIGRTFAVGIRYSY
jgi:iron complex outermembrane recepter protein